jgi:hypothetical protein
VYRESPAGQTLQVLGELLNVVLLPLRVVWFHLHRWAYETSLAYNDFCMQEARREWVWTNLHQPEMEVWTFLWQLAKSLVLWATYFAITPARVAWTLPPLVYALIVSDSWGDLLRKGSFLSFVTFWFLKFPVGSELVF